MEGYKKHIEEGAKNFKLSPKDLHNLYDLLHIADTPPQVPIDFRKTLKMNKMEEWFDKFFEKVERIVVPELYHD